MRKQTNGRKGWALRALALGGAFAVFVCGALAQTTTEKKSGTVVYASGNEVVVKLDGTGEVKHFHVANNRTFNVDGKTLGIHDLQPGMHLTRTITTTSQSRVVRSVRVVKGKVWLVHAPYVIVTLEDGTNKQYKVPNGMTFDIDGEKKDVFHLRKGMNLTATIVTETPETIVSQSTAVTGKMPPPPPETPPIQGALLVVEEKPAPVEMAKAESPAPAAAPEEKPAKLPKTGSNWPLMGLLGILLLSVGFGLRLARTARS